MADTYKVKNKMGHPIPLQNAAGDEVQVPPGIHTVDASFIDFQLPPLAQAEVIGYDYAARLSPSASAPTETF